LRRLGDEEIGGGCIDYLETRTYDSENRYILGQELYVPVVYSVSISVLEKGICSPVALYHVCDVFFSLLGT
jgi:hypothetical protein